MQTARLFPNGQSQAVRLPKEFRFEGDRVYIQRMGEAVVLLPFQRPWQVLFDSLAHFSADFAGADLADAENRDADDQGAGDAAAAA